MRAVDRQILIAARRMLQLRLVVGSVGNVSARAGTGIRITPTRTGYGDMTRRDLVSVAPDGTQVAGRRRPSRELPLHLAVYRERLDVGAIVHTHSPYATAWSFLGLPLEPRTEEIAYYGIGPVRSARPAPAGTEDLARNAAAALGSSAAVLLGNHGVLSTGPSVPEALVVAEAVEHQAQVAWLLSGARMMGEVLPPPGADGG